MTLENYEARLDMLLSAWRCPVCASPLQMQQGIGAGQLCCLGARVHTFDLSRSGYVHLSPRHSGGGDSKEAVRARTAFLSAGYYESAARTLCELLCAHAQGPLVVDAGCGEGYYTSLFAKNNTLFIKTVKVILNLNTLHWGRFALGLCA